MLEVDFNGLQKKQVNLTASDVIPKDNSIMDTDELCLGVKVDESIDVVKKKINIKKNDQGVLVASVIDTEKDATREVKRDENIEGESGYEEEFVELSTNSDSDYVCLVDVQDPFNATNQLISGVEVVVDNNVLEGNGSSGSGNGSFTVVDNETWTNKRFESTGTYTVENVMNDSSKAGVSKDSTFVIDIDTPDITQISNHLIESNGLQSIAIPNGYDAVDSISVNVQVPSNNEMYATHSILDVNNNNYKISDLMSDNSTRDGLDKNANIRVQVPSDVNNADVNSENNNIISSNGNYIIPNGKTGWNSFFIEVPSNNELSATNSTLVNNNHQYSVGDLMSTNSTKDGLDKNATFTVQIPSDVDNADVSNNVGDNDYPLVSSNGTYVVPNGKTGFNSFSVQVPLKFDLIGFQVYFYNSYDPIARTSHWEDISVDINSNNFKTVANGDYYPEWTLSAFYESQIVIIFEIDLINGVFKLIPIFFTTTTITF